MTLVRFNNDGIGKDMQRIPFFSPMFTDVFDTAFGKEPVLNEIGGFIPAVNIAESKDEHHIETALPGFQKEQISIHVEGKVLTISGERKKEQQETAVSYTKREFNYGKFKRVFTLPNSVESDKIQATFNDGILNISLPKRDEAKEKPARTIQIL